MSLIFTTKGNIELNTLSIKQNLIVEDSSYTTATEFYLGEELVRRDVNVTLFRGLESAVEQGGFG